MPQDPNKLYSVEKTTIWFAVASVLLTVSLVLMVGQDYGREWKKWQKKFIKFEREKTERDLKTVEAGIDSKQLDTLKAELKSAQTQFDQNKAQYEKLLREKSETEVLLTQVSSRYQDLKQFHDSYRFFLEEHRAHGDKKKIKEFEEKIAELGPNFEQAKLDQEAVEKKIDDLDQQIQSFVAEEKRLNKEIGKTLRDKNQLEFKLQKLKPSAVEAMLNAPMLDFVAPSLQIQQVVLEDLHDDFYFAKAQKVDRCTTCHLAIDRKGFEDAPQPFKTHPNLDLFLSSSSPHPLEKMGCTVCHGGSGQSLDFVHTAHTPRNDEQAKEWKKKYHWHELEKWEAKMLPLQHAQASCAKCHQGVMEVPQAPKLNEGRRIAQQSGCFACHTVKGFESRWKVGPSLLNIQSKVDREWIVRWLQNPKEFRSSTQMPRVFHLENTNSPEDRVKSNAAIEGIATYLLRHSEPAKLESPLKDGDPEMGKQLVKDLGCLGCHNVGDAKTNDHGPELVNLGSKVTKEWLFTWLKNPKHISSDTRMPNLRLNDQEAAHITSYLLQSKNQKFDEMPIPPIEEKDVDQLALDYMTRKMRQAEAGEKLGKMDLEEKFEFVGREMILQQGCFGCHAIHGFSAENRTDPSSGGEDAKPIGTELTKEGQKEVDKFYFGYVDVDHTRQAWFFQKLKNPRIFDRGKIVGYHEKLRMPDFGFTDEQAEALTTFLLSLREEDIPLEMQRELNLKEKEIESGRFLVSKLNCQGCHTLDGVDGRVRPLFEDLGSAPPILDGEGAKVHEFWLYHFLEKPELIRPWLKIRMPTFDFNETDTNTIVRYFHNLAEQEFSFAPSTQHATTESIHTGRNLFTQLKCIQCHQPGSSDAPSLSASFLAPDLTLARERLKPDWMVQWLKDPQTLQPGTMMPTFFPEGQTPFQDILDGDMMKQIQAIKDYLLVFTPEEITRVKGTVQKEGTES
ncbi:MAG: c-type cytochrome [Candidatus Omnitrophica bacterium]|nr:c-type cytochrome [Candidatus Omnitrophota bacterium]